VVEKARMRGHSTETVLGDGSPNSKRAISAIRTISHEGWKEKRASGRWLQGDGCPSSLPRGSPDEPASEFSHTGFSSAGVCCFPSCQNCSIKGTHWAHPAFRGPSRGTPRPAPRHAGAGGAQQDRRNAADRLDPSLLMSHSYLLHPTHHANKR
jgi:hypothetical protein